MSGVSQSSSPIATRVSSQFGRLTIDSLMIERPEISVVSRLEQPATYVPG